MTLSASRSSVAERYDIESRATTQIYADLLGAEPGIRGTVLDVGCGPGFHGHTLSVLANMPVAVDGLDPSAEVHQHPHLRHRWRGEFESLADEIAGEGYDLAYTFNVVEHIREARPFFESVRKVLKPGAVFWAMTPNGGHPFTWISRFVEVVGAKLFYARRHEGVNQYPAYYRLNKPSQVLRAIEGLGFRSAEFHYLPGGWDNYFPRGLKWAPKLVDWLVCNRFHRRHLILFYRLEAGE